MVTMSATRQAFNLAPVILQLALYLTVASIGDLPCVASSRALLRGGLLGGEAVASSNLAARGKSGSRSGAEASILELPVLGSRRRAKLLAAVLAATTAGPASPPSAKRPLSSPRFRPPSPRRVPSPPVRKPSPSPRQVSSPLPPPSALSSRSSEAAVELPSQVCGAINLISPRDESGTLTYTFGKQISCDGAAEWMVKNLTDAARQAGAHISIPFALESCSSTYDPIVKPPVVPYVMVCGSFTNVKEAAKLQKHLNTIMAQWPFLVLGRSLPNESPSGLPYMCPPLGYTIQTMVWGTEEESPIAFSEVQCSSRGG